MYRSIPNVTFHVRRPLPFQISNPRSQNLISNFKSLFLSFSLSKIPIWIFLHGSCCSVIRLIRHLDLDLTFNNLLSHELMMKPWMLCLLPSPKRVVLLNQSLTIDLSGCLTMLSKPVEPDRLLDCLPASLRPSTANGDAGKKMHADHNKDLEDVVYRPPTLVPAKLVPLLHDLARQILQTGQQQQLFIIYSH